MSKHRTLKNQKSLPDLTPYQVEGLCEFLASNFDESYLRSEEYCCPEDGIDDGYRLAQIILRVGYGLPIEELEEDEDDE